MIQRIQSVWLLLASAFAFLSMKYPFYFISAHPDTLNDQFNATNNIFLLILTAILGTLCLFTIFVFKQRRMQFWLTVLALFISLLNIFLYYTYKKENPGGGMAFTSFFVYLIPLFLFFAARGIYRDQKLVKSMDRLR